jgi:hypothetical protein
MATQTDIQNLPKTLENCYRKFKRYVFNNRSLEFLKIRICNFEVDDLSMQKVFNSLAKAIIENDGPYFDTLFSQMSYFCSIKAISEPNSVKAKEKNKDIVSNDDHHSSLLRATGINLFADVPIELFIFDTYWTILISSVLNKTKLLDNDYANKISNRLFHREEINYQSLELFEPYYQNYRKWKNLAVNKVEELYDESKNSILVSLDLSRYFYSVNFNFQKLFSALIETDSDYTLHTFEHNMAAKMHSVYSQKIAEVDKTIGDKIVLPIGMPSSGVLANWYLYEFDNAVIANNAVRYYGRYVDDMVIVIEGGSTKKTKIETILETYLPGLFPKEKSDVFHLKGFQNLSIQASKIKVIQSFYRRPKNIIESLKKEKFPASEPRLISESDYQLTNFLSDIYNVSDSIKIREAGELTINNQKLMGVISSIIKEQKNLVCFAGTKSDDGTARQKEATKQLKKFFSPRVLLSLSSRWSKIFLFAGLNGKLLPTVIQHTQTAKNNVTLAKQKLGAIYRCDLLLDHLKSDLEKLFNVALGSFYAIAGDLAAKDAEPKVKLFGEQIRQTNLLDYTCLSFPMINYLQNLPRETDFFKFSLSCLPASSAFSLVKLKYSPRFIGLGEFLIVYTFCHLKDMNNKDFLSSAISYYDQNIGVLFGSPSSEVHIDTNASSSATYSLVDVSLPNIPASIYGGRDPIIAFPNLNLLKHLKKNANVKSGIFYPQIFNRNYKTEIARILNQSSAMSRSEGWAPFIADSATSKNEGFSPLDFIVFPECSVPLEWLPLLDKYSRLTGIGIVCGLMYFEFHKRVFNLQATILPYRTEGYFVGSIVLIREKNNYAPFEIERIAKNQLTSQDSQPPLYYLFHWRDLSFSSFVCYELTDIDARSLLRGKCELIITCEFNQDVTYF